MSKSKDKKIKYTELEHMLKNELNSDNSLSKNAPIELTVNQSVYQKKSQPIVNQIVW